MTSIHTQQHIRLLPTPSGYVVDARTARWKIQTRRQAIVLTVAGELDASACDRFEESLRHIVSVGDPFVVDVTGVDFLGAQYVRIFLDLDRQCRTARIGWALVVAPTRQPLLRIADQFGGLPVASSVSEALGDLATAPRRVVRLVPRLTRSRGGFGG
jgi:anti-anti-sigma factor